METSALSQLQEIQQQGKTEILACKTLQDIENVHTQLLGKKSPIKSILKTIGALPPEQRKQIGQESNRIDQELEQLWNDRKMAILNQTASAEEDQDIFDITEPAIFPAVGSLHPMTQTCWELEQIFISMGFEVIDGREVESEYNNFEALNIPAHHPARDMQDTFFLSAPPHSVLRTHTSNFQVKTMKNKGVPLRAVSYGRVFRNEAIDPSHENTFYQLEGLMVDRDIHVGHLIGVMKTMLRGIMKREVKIRLRPGYFPFVEPGFELDMDCVHCESKGCRVCKHTGWVEMLGCGMVHPNVLREGKVDTAHYSGFAFGIGLNRLIMMRYKIDDIRHFLSGDIRFVSQF